MEKERKVKNPLHKRFVRELKQDFGKYLVIFLFIVVLVSLISSYFVVADSIKKTFNENLEKYNIEDGHVTFNQGVDEEVLESIEEKGDLKLYNLNYVEETVGPNDANLRIYSDRKDVDLVCLYSGEMPEGKNEIGLDRNFANNNHYSIGDTIEINGKEFTVSGYVSLVDYTSLYEKESNMMFDSISFGVAIVTDEGYEYLDSAHVFYNYAWKYNETPADKVSSEKRGKELTDILEDELKAYDTTIIQGQVDELYAQATEIQNQLTDEFDLCSDEIESKLTKAGETVFSNAQKKLSQEQMMSLYMSGAATEDYLKAAYGENTTMDGLIADELGISRDALTDLENAVDEYSDEMDSMEDSTSEAPVVNLDDIDDGYENEMDFSLDDIRSIVEKIDATGLYDTTKINSLLDQLEGLMDFQVDKETLLMVDDFVNRVDSKAVNYVMDDMAGDYPMYEVFDYIIVAILAFIFAVTISNTITAESGVIGTLRALGYTRAELIRHYLFLPIVVVILGSIVGNAIGYTIFPIYYKEIFYKSFSLAPYVEYFNMNAFVNTTIIPLILMFVINLGVLYFKLKISPMKFLRHDLGKKKNRKAIGLSKKIPFFTRFRLRILFQNIPAYSTLVIGILLGGMIVVFGLMFGPLLDDIGESIQNSKFCNYQYVLKDQIETSDEDAEKYCTTSLDTTIEGYLTDEITIYGIEDESKYVELDIPEGEVYISNGLMAKYDYEVGDTFILNDPVSEKEYEFRVAGEYQYDAALCVFMSRDDYNEQFGEKADYFTGYFDNHLIEDIDDRDIVTIVTGDELASMADALENSFGSFMDVFEYFGIFMFLLLMYLMTKQVIEKNMQSIAMTKILGFKDSEIARLYLVITSLVTLGALLISVPVTKVLLQLIFDKYIYMELSGYIPCKVADSCYVKEVLLGIGCYAVICALMMFKINRISKSEALKNVE